LNKERLDSFTSKLDSIESQLADIPVQLQEAKAMYSKKESEKHNLDVEWTNVYDRHDKLWFFKFKEKTALNAEMDRIAKIRDVVINEKTDLRNKIDALTKREDELKREQLNVQQERDKFKYEEELKDSASSGDAQAQFDLATLYFKAKNPKQAAEWLNKAVEQGHDGAKKLAAKIKADEERAIAEKKAAEERAIAEKKAAEERAIAAKKAAAERIRAASYDLTLW